MNHVLRSPDISETPFVIPIKSGGPADVAEDEGNFQSLDVVPEDEQESLEIEDAAEDPNRTQDSSRDEAAEQEVRSGADEKTQSGQVNIERDSNEDSPQTLTEEEDEVMIGLEEVAEGDATMVSGSETSDSETTDGTSKLPKSAGEIEALVEARLKEFEDRFQQEKEDVKKVEIKINNNLVGDAHSNWGKVPRNAKCPCGSGNKFKHCHGKLI